MLQVVFWLNLLEFEVYWSNRGCYEVRGKRRASPDTCSQTFAWVQTYVGWRKRPAAAPRTLPGWSNSFSGICLHGGGFVTRQFQWEKPGEARGNLPICIPQAVPSGIKKNKPEGLILMNAGWRSADWLDGKRKGFESGGVTIVVSPGRLMVVLLRAAPAALPGSPAAAFPLAVKFRASSQCIISLDVSN